MWNSVFLDSQLARSLYKSALKTGTISVISPDSESEKKQLDDWLRDINRSRMGNVVLAYCLLGERVYIDPPPLGNFVFSDLDEDVRDARCRDFILSWSPEISAFIEPTDSGLNYTVRGGHTADSREVANTIASMEPLIWKSYRDEKVDLYRDDVRKALDLLVANPRLIEIKKKGIMQDVEDEFASEVADTASALWPARSLSPTGIQFFSYVIRKTITKGEVATNKVFEAYKRDALYPVRNLSLGRTRYGKSVQPFPGVSSEDITAAVGIFLDEVQWWPNVDNITEVVKLRKRPEFKDFRVVLTDWADAVTRGDDKRQQKIRSDIRRANRALRQVARCQKGGRFLAYLGVPLVAIDLFLGPIFGASATVCGFALQGYADWLRREHRWLLIAT